MQALTLINFTIFSVINIKTSLRSRLELITLQTSSMDSKYRASLFSIRSSFATKKKANHTEEVNPVI